MWCYSSVPMNWFPRALFQVQRTFSDGEQQHARSLQINVPIHCQINSKAVFWNRFYYQQHYFLDSRMSNMQQPDFSSQVRHDEGPITFSIEKYSSMCLRMIAQWTCSLIFRMKILSNSGVCCLRGMSTKNWHLWLCFCYPSVQPQLSVKGGFQ